MSRALSFAVLDWLPGAGFGELERETLASLKIVAGADSIPVTEVEDRAASTVRDHINVPAFPLARWLLANFWRLRWEPTRSRPSADWLEAHSLAAIDGAHAWPSLDFASDGQFVQLRMEAESSADVAGIRYLRDVVIDVPGADFEQAVLEFVETVEARVAALRPGRQALAELRDEIAAERADPEQAERCRLQALAGIDPGAASEDWFDKVEDLARTLGHQTAHELVAVSPELPGGLSGVESTLKAMRASPQNVRLDWVPETTRSPAPDEPTWQRGERLASCVRTRLNLSSGPVPNSRLEELFEVKLPLLRSASLPSPELSGGYRNGADGGLTTVLVPTAHRRSQRFYLARLIGAASQLAGQHVLPVSKAGTALQKLERAFAAEFLCPWAELSAFCNDHGTDDDAITEAAAHFDVSELLVLSSLVNKGKAPRSRLLRNE